jgi:hypothetical protein
VARDVSREPASEQPASGSLERFATRAVASLDVCGTESERALHALNARKTAPSNTTAERRAPVSIEVHQN